ncbi:hypothetical protein FB45DRAFT_1055262 [Roridomyces roridus]|uniref:NAD(P)-binding protein n=1 Tax=Roridomyces roridus TaxID=1738132 RepID=A0AAD7FUV9_9AGAR|nr:hypothetical protein FB45DRAFT_1055262 [Roridomyces roridus]
MAQDLWSGIFQAKVPPLPESLSFVGGKTALITGANAGLGRAASLQLAQRQISTLILAVRTRKNGEATKADILADPIVAALSTKPTILVYEVDLGRPSSVASFASSILAEIPTLNILLLNAAMVISTFKQSPEAENEIMFQVNYISNAILSVRLLPLLRSTAESCGQKSHLSIVGSRAQKHNDFIEHPIPDSMPIFAFLNDRKKFKVYKRYADTKTLVSMFVRELAKYVDPSVVTVNAVCPGMVKTTINDKQAAWIRVFIAAVFAVRARPVAVGARTLINAVAAGPEGHGQQMGDYQIWANKFLETEQGKKMQKRLWEETLALAEKEAPGSVQEAKLQA